MYHPEVRTWLLTGNDPRISTSTVGLFEPRSVGGHRAHAQVRAPASKARAGLTVPLQTLRMPRALPETRPLDGAAKARQVLLTGAEHSSTTASLSPPLLFPVCPVPSSSLRWDPFVNECCPLPCTPICSDYTPESL